MSFNSPTKTTGGYYLQKFIKFLGNRTLVTIVELRLGWEPKQVFAYLCSAESYSTLKLMDNALSYQLNG